MRNRRKQDRPRRLTGVYVTTTTVGERVQAFIPDPLPPTDLGLSKDTYLTVERAILALGRLDSAASFLPDRDLMLYYYVRKEAVLSSQIEGTQSSLADLLMYEAAEPYAVPLDDVAEVSGYVRALEYGMARLHAGFPLSNRLLREMHAQLLTGGRSQDKAPGEFRRSQNWIGGSRPGDARFVPPPPDRVEECMGQLERFFHGENGRFGIVEKVALAHVQFETIHPFLDGNGRLGRLLIALLLCHDGILKDPILYVSLYLKKHRAEYYEYLDRVRKDGDWDGWIRFCAAAIDFAATQAAATASRLSELARAHRSLIFERSGRGAGSVIQVFDVILRRPLTRIHEICAATGLVPNTVAAALRELCELEIAREISGRRRGRLYAYFQFMEIMNEDTQPL